MADKGYLIDFIEDAVKDMKLQTGFITILKKPKATVMDLERFFTKNGYKISSDDCKKILKNKNGILKIKQTSVKIAY